MASESTIDGRQTEEEEIQVGIQNRELGHHAMLCAFHCAFLSSGNHRMDGGQGGVCVLIMNEEASFLSRSS